MQFEAAEPADESDDVRSDISCWIVVTCNGGIVCERMRKDEVLRLNQVLGQV